jgi:hypothetical protein
LRVVRAEALNELVDGRAVGKHEREHGCRRETGETAAKTNTNLHDDRPADVTPPVAWSILDPVSPIATVGVTGAVAWTTTGL